MLSRILKRFFSTRPMMGLLEHYEPIAKGTTVIQEALRCYMADGADKTFQILRGEINKQEEHADKIKRNIRNHLPRAAFLIVDKNLFMNYTRSQDNILDSAQEAMNWLGMSPMSISEAFQKDLMDFATQVAKSVSMLKPALQATIGLVHGEHQDRKATKAHYIAIRHHHFRISKIRYEMLSAVYNSDMEFKTIFQLINFINCLHEMSHNSEGSAYMLRAMIAR